MADYGTVEGVNGYVRHMTFDEPNNPTSDEVERFLVSRSAMLNGWLNGAGYVTPVTSDYADAKAALDEYANLGGAGLCELTRPGAGWDEHDENQRENKFLSQFEAAKEWIQSGALAAMGVPQKLVGSLAAGQPTSGQIIAGTQWDKSRFGFPPEWWGR